MKEIKDCISLHYVESAFPYHFTMKIDTKEEFDDFYYKALEERDSLYRGEGDARWICRSSLLRDFRNRCMPIIGDEYFKKSFMRYKYTHLDKETEILMDNHEGCGFRSCAQGMEIALQHYGHKTSLIDFSKDIKVALCFAAEYNLNWNEEAPHRYMKIIRLRHAVSLSEPLACFYESMSGIVSTSKDPQVRAAASEAIQESFESDNSCIWDTNRDNIAYIDPLDIEFLHPYLSNRRIEAQKGVLVHTGIHQPFSLEEAVATIRRDMNAQVEMDVTLIHAGLAHYIMEKLAAVGVTYKSLFPDKL